MNIITTSTLRSNLADSLQKVKADKNYLLIASRGTITSAIVDIDMFEDLVAQANKKYLKSIQKARKEFERGEYVSHDQVFGDLA